MLLLGACLNPGGGSDAGPEATALYDRALALLVERSARAQRIGQAVSLAGDGICAELTPVPGMAVINVDDLWKPLRAAAARSFGSGRGIVVTEVFDGMPGAVAGAQSGDRIVEAEEGRIRLPSRELWRLGLRAAAPLVLPAVEGTALRLRIERAGGPRTLELPVSPGCAYPVSLSQLDAVNAFAWKEQVVLHTGLMRFMPRDEALALVVGHEIAHIVLAHTRRNLGRSTDAERAADYLGAYLASRAGFTLEPEDYALLQLSYEDPERLVERARATHPSGPERQLAFERTLGEIHAKRAAGLALVPEGFE